MCKRRFSPHVARVAVATFIAVAASAPESRAEEQADPWATLRACLVVLDRFAQCSSDEAFGTFVERWIVAESVAPKATRKEIERRLRWWMRPVGRREQCAIWTRRAGAGAHVGEASPLKKASESKGVTCEELAQKIEKDRWIPAALIDARQD
jgi:hypothetical protein